MKFNKNAIVEKAMAEKYQPYNWAANHTREAVELAIDLTISNIACRDIDAARRLNKLTTEKENIIFIEQMPVLAKIAELENELAASNRKIETELELKQTIQQILRDANERNRALEGMLQQLGHPVSHQSVKTLAEAHDLFRKKEKIEIAPALASADLNKNFESADYKNSEIRIATMDEMKKSLIIGALVLHDNNKDEAAKALGISKSNLYLNIKKFRLNNYLRNEESFEDLPQ